MPLPHCAISQFRSPRQSLPCPLAIVSQHLVSLRRFLSHLSRLTSVPKPVTRLFGRCPARPGSSAPRDGPNSLPLYRVPQLPRCIRTGSLFFQSFTPTSQLLSPYPFTSPHISAAPLQTVLGSPPLSRLPLCQPTDILSYSPTLMPIYPPHCRYAMRAPARASSDSYLVVFTRLPNFIPPSSEFICVPIRPIAISSLALFSPAITPSST